MISKSPEEAQKFRAQLTKGISHKGCESPIQIVILLFEKLHLGSLKVPTGVVLQHVMGRVGVA